MNLLRNWRAETLTTINKSRDEFCEGMSQMVNQRDKSLVEEKTSELIDKSDAMISDLESAYQQFVDFVN